jgi:NAD(P)H-dependent FMN reductase
MPDSPLKLAVIIGSVREGRFGPTVANWFVGQTEGRENIEVDLIDLADVPLGTSAPAMNPDDRMMDGIKQLTPRLAAADAFVVVTPEYNHSYPGSLKNVLDWHNLQFQAKPVAFVSYGGISGGLRAVEHLRHVFAELHAVTTRDTVSFHNAGAQFGPDGEPLDAEATSAAAKVLLDQLTWWGQALKEAREKAPYGS